MTFIVEYINEFVRNRYQNIWAVDTPSHLEFEYSYIIQLSIEHVTDFNAAVHASPPSGGIVRFRYCDE